MRQDQEHLGSVRVNLGCEARRTADKDEREDGGK